MKFSIFISLACLIVIAAAQNSCNGFAPEEGQSGVFFSWNYGIQDSNDGVSTPYASHLYSWWWERNYDSWGTQEDGFMDNFFTYMINSVPLMGGKNATFLDINPFVPTASFVCDTPYSGTWGPLYPSYYRDSRIRGSHFDLEVMSQYSAPNQTSYIRNVVNIKNVGTSPQMVSLAADWFSESDYGIDISPVSNEGRYYTAWPFQENDPGQNNTFPYNTYNTYLCQSIHTRGPNSRVSQAIIHADWSNYLVGPTYYTELAAGEEMSLMYIVSTGTNVTVALKNAAEIDTEPAHIFHDLNANQLSLIRNWGGCQVIIGPTVTVTVNAPSQCSSGVTSDFTVTATSTRVDVSAADFKHRVVFASGDEIVSAQSSTTLTVLNGVGQVTHQLWYKQCLVKETSFTACATPAAPTSTPIATPTGKVSSSSSLSVHAALVSVVLLFVSSVSHTRSTRTTMMIVVLCLVGLVFNNGVAAQESTCLNVAVGNTASPIDWYFGSNDGGGSPIYSSNLYFRWWTEYDLYAYTGDSMFDSNFFNFWINSVPLTGAKNFTVGQSSHTPTANFTCDTNYSGMWGPAYPDYREEEEGERGRFQNLEAYVHYSAPEATSYVRAVLFVKNIGSTPERVRVSGDWYVNYFGNDLAPLNEGRYFVPFPWQDGDEGGNDPFSRLLHSVHFSGPNARDKNVLIVREFDDFVISPAYYTTLAAGQEMALMFIISSATNRTTALKTGASIDAEPAQIFHNLNADQLSLIRNWGACKAVITPTVTVTVNAPSQCSSGVTSDFTVTATSTRTDLTDGFKHRVVSSLFRNTPLVPAQTSTTLAVRNGAGPLVHQLWYKECLVKETNFNACA